MHVTSDKPTQNDLLVATPGTTVIVLGTVDSPEKGVSNESNQQPNIYVSKPTIQPNEHILSPTKYANPLLSKQLSVGSSGVAKPGPTRALARASAYLALASKTDKNHVIVC